MKRKPVIYIMVFVVLCGVGGFLLYNNSAVNEFVTIRKRSGDGCKSGVVAGRISYNKDSQTSDSKVEEIIRKHRGEITQRFSNFGGIAFVDVPSGSEEKVISELKLLPGVNAEQEKTGCSQ